MWTICDCSQNEPIAYIPYRVYVGDTVIVKKILEKWALIPEDINSKGYYTGNGSITATAGAYERTWEVSRWVPNPYAYEKGYWEYYTGVSGGPVIWHDGDLIIQPNLAYEYVDIQVSGYFGGYRDFIWFKYGYGTNSPYNGIPTPIDIYHPSSNFKYWPHWRYINSNTIRIDVYPGLSDGTAGRSKPDGGLLQIWFSFEISGGYLYTRIEPQGYQAQGRILTTTYKGTGRYGNYR